MRAIVALIIACACMQSCHINYKASRLNNKDSISINNLSRINRTDSLLINPPYIPEPTSGSDNNNYIVVKTFYATDRNSVSKGARPYFGNERSQLKYGTCDVSIPITHEIGTIEAKSIFKLDFTETPDRHIVILNIKAATKEKFIFNLNNSSEKSALIYIHGYNTSFGEAASRTAQLCYDLKFKGTPIFYSWPSQDDVFKYTVDEENNAWSTNNFSNFLHDFLDKTNIKEVYLVAHSMGSRILANSLIKILGNNADSNKTIKEVILAAPDIDADVFKRDFAPVISNKTNLTLYASSNDNALLLSKYFHGYRRAGDTNKAILVSPKMETIDATNVSTSVLGHSYFGESRLVINDLFDLINNNLRATKRHLSAKRNRIGTYWEFAK